LVFPKAKVSKLKHLTSYNHFNFESYPLNVAYQHHNSFKFHLNYLNFNYYLISMFIEIEAIYQRCNETIQHYMIVHLDFKPMKSFEKND